MFALFQTIARLATMGSHWATSGGALVFSINIAWYLFLAGAGAGAYAVAALVGLGARRGVSACREASALVASGFLAGLVLVAASCVVLAFDLGSPANILNLFWMPHPTYLTFGSWTLVAFLLLATSALITRTFLGHIPSAVIAAQVAEVVSLVLALGLMVYTGLLVSTMNALPALNTPLIPVLFVVSAFSTGVATILVVGFFRNADARVRRGFDWLLRIDAWAIALEVVLVVAWAFYLAFAADDALRHLVAGDAAGLFWGALVLVGLIAPFALERIALAQGSTAVAASSATGVLIGGMALRLCVVSIAVVPAVSVVALL